MSAAINHWEGNISRSSSNIRARQHGSDLCGRPPPQGPIFGSMSWTASLPSIIQNGRTALRMRLPKLNRPNDLPGTGDPVEVLVLALLAFTLALLRCPRWPPTSGKDLSISLT